MGKEKERRTTISATEKPKQRELVEKKSLVRAQEAMKSSPTKTTTFDAGAANVHPIKADPPNGDAFQADAADEADSGDVFQGGASSAGDAVPAVATDVVGKTDAASAGDAV